MVKEKDAYYFPHDSNSRNDEKILLLRVDYGYEGFGLFWGIIEIMREQKDFKLIFDTMNSLSIALHYDTDKLKSFVEDCITKYKLFELKDGKFFSNRLVRSMKKRKQLQSKMKANAMQRWSKDNNTTAKQERKGKERKGKEKKEVLFYESDFKNFEDFRDAFISNSKYSKYDVNYYYEAVKNWSESSGAKKKDWIATARGFANRDEKDNKAKLKPISYKSNDHGKYDPSTAHL